MTKRWVGAAVLAGLGAILPGPAAEPPAKGKAMPGVTKAAFGQTADGTAVDLYTLTNAAGVTLKAMTYGGIVTELHVPDKNGQFADVVLGFDDLKGYLGGHPYFGALVGRVANRVAKGKFTLDGREYTLAVNNGPNALHGGKVGFDKVVWRAEPLTSDRGPGLRLRHRSPDGDEGYPGTLDVAVEYWLGNDSTWRIEYAATADKATPINLSQHAYFNLAGHGAGPVLGHEMMIAADRYTPVDDTLIPTGELKPVTGTPMDFTTPTPIGARIRQVGGQPVGYDHNYVLRPDAAPAVRVREPTSGRVLEMTTTEPGVQFYTGNFLDGTVTGKGGAVYRQYGGFCLEAQHFPDSVHHPSFPSTILRPGQTYRQTTVYTLTAR
jgi:aldose 1-epimerase